MLLLKRTTDEQRGCKQSREPKEHHDRLQQAGGNAFTSLCFPGFSVFHQGPLQHRATPPLRGLGARKRPHGCSWALPHLCFLELFLADNLSGEEQPFPKPVYFPNSGCHSNSVQALSWNLPPSSGKLRSRSAASESTHFFSLCFCLLLLCFFPVNTHQIQRVKLGSAKWGS